MSKTHAEIAFLFLGEMLLVPHLWPIVDALARMRPNLRIDLWISTSVHEQLIGGWLCAEHGNVRLRRAPGFRSFDGFAPGRNPPVPAKLPMLARLVPRLSHARVVVCAEQTSLWIPRVLPMRTRFIFTVHGAGPLNYNRDGRLKYAARLLVPSALHTPEHLANNIRPERIIITGYAKASFNPSVRPEELFSEPRPILLYTPHWQNHRSSWWDWGRAIVAMLAKQDRYNVILAPHQRLFERDKEAGTMLAEVAKLPHVHVDSDSFAMVDGSYTAMADLYLGDTSSQIVEYLGRPRPCVILESPNMKWRSNDMLGYRACGDTVTELDRIWPAILAAEHEHPLYISFQTDFAARALGDVSGAAPFRAAEAILEAAAF